MKKNISIIIAIAVACLFTISCVSKQDNADCVKHQVSHRKVALQCYTFKKFTFEETLGQIRGVDFDALEATPAQIVSAKFPVKFGPEMNAETRAEVKRMLKEAGLKFVSYGVVHAQNDADVKKYLEFAKYFDMEGILVEDSSDILAIWDKYSPQFGVKIYLHHHSSFEKRANFHSPYKMAEELKKYANIYANPDNGHWSRDGIGSVEGFRALKGKIASVHFKDQAKFGDSRNRSVPYGAGELDARAMLAELDAQGFDGYFVIEYQADSDDPLPAVKKCVDFLRNN